MTSCGCVRVCGFLFCLFVFFRLINSENVLHCRFWQKIKEQLITFVYFPINILMWDLWDTSMLTVCMSICVCYPGHFSRSWIYIERGFRNYAKGERKVEKLHCLTANNNKSIFLLTVTVAAREQ